MTSLPGYDDHGPEGGPGLARDGSALLELPGFWAAHLGEILDMGIDDELAALFGVDLAEIVDAYRRMSDPAAWPVLPVGGELAVVYRNCEEDPGVDFLLLSGGDTPCIRIAVIEGALEGPGISWPELLSIADRRPDPVGRARALVLLAPMLGDVAAEADVLAAALRTVGVGGDVETIADGIVAQAPAEWRRTADGVLVCDDDCSARHPGGLPADQLRTVAERLSRPGRRSA